MDNRGNRTAAIFGVILITIGVLTLLGQFSFNSPYWGAGLTIAIGLVFFGGAAAGGRTFSVLAIPGAILTVLGLVQVVEIAFPSLNAGIYGWALVVAAVGLGMAIFGRLLGSPDLERGGWGVARAGLVFFLVVGIVIELFLTFTGGSSGPRSLIWPVVLILTGVVTLALRMFRLAQDGELLGGAGSFEGESSSLQSAEPAVVIEPRVHEDEDAAAVARRAERKARRLERRAIRRAARRERHDNNLFEPVLWIGFGILWLQLSMNLLSFNNLMALLSLWPVLLIVAGLSVLFGRRQPLVNLALGLLLVMGVFYAANNTEQLGLAGRSPWQVLGVNINSGENITERVSGSGTITTETRQVSGFTGVVLNGGGEMELVSGSSAGLAIETDDNLLPYLTSEVRSGQLYLGVKEGVGISPSRLRYTITINQLERLSINGAANVTVDELSGRDLDINISGFGALDMPKLTYNNLNVQLSGSGSVIAGGQADRLNVQISGAGSFNAPELRSLEANVQISGVGRAVVWAVDKLSSGISGLGSVGYYGSPALSKNTGGLGLTNKLGEK